MIKCYPQKDAGWKQKLYIHCAAYRQRFKEKCIQMQKKILSAS